MNLQRAWKKAKCVLLEIAAGLYSDPPDVDFYCQRLDACGRLATDEHGTPLLDCSRGTNDTECVHKQIITAFGSWCTSTRMSDALLRDFRHRYNQRVSERRRMGFPRLGHFSSWLTETLQCLVERNHNVLLYPAWSNSSEYGPTDETIGTAPLQSRELTAAVNAIELLQEPKLTLDQQYLADCMGVQLPFLPVDGPEETRLFTKLVLEQRNETPDFAAMALEWCQHVDGHSVYPKLPVYLRLHHSNWQVNSRVREAVTGAAAGHAALARLNTATAPAEPSGAGPVQAAPQQHPPMPAAPATAAYTSTAVAGGIVVGGVVPDTPDPPPRNHPPPQQAPGMGGGAGAPRKRKQRSCRRCNTNKCEKCTGAQWPCKGSGGAVLCEHFNEDGSLL